MDYKDCIKEISINLGFESFKGIIGNSNASDAVKILQDINPLNYKEVDSSGRTKSKLPRVTKEMMLALQNDGNKKK